MVIGFRFKLHSQQSSNHPNHSPNRLRQFRVPAFACCEKQRAPARTRATPSVIFPLCFVRCCLLCFLPAAEHLECSLVLRVGVWACGRVGVWTCGRVGGAGGAGGAGVAVGAHARVCPHISQHIFHRAIPLPLFMIIHFCFLPGFFWRGGFFVGYITIRPVIFHGGIDHAFRGLFRIVPNQIIAMTVHIGANTAPVKKTTAKKSPQKNL